MESDSALVPRRYIDAHCHLHEYSDDEVRKLASSYVIIAVSDDAESSVRTLELANRYGVYACVGVHPWEVGKVSDRDLAEVERLVSQERVACIGEVGLDKKFVPQTYERQLEVFKRMVRLAVEYSLPMNLHTAGAWRDVFELVLSAGVDRALFHWYSGPLDLLSEIISVGYFVSINPAVTFQRKHQRVVKEAPLSSILTESDGPYKYRGLDLGPPLIKLAVEKIAEIKGIKIEDVVRAVSENARRFLGVNVL